jgi:hypothetical protein
VKDAYREISAWMPMTIGKKRIQQIKEDVLLVELDQSKQTLTYRHTVIVQEERINLEPLKRRFMHG